MAAANSHTPATNSVWERWSSVPGEIQISEATRNLLDGRFTFVDGGGIEIKGKGPMQTYLLQS